MSLRWAWIPTHSSRISTPFADFLAYRAALAAAKDRGVVLGSATLHIARERAIASNQAAADERAAKVLPIIRKAQKAGATSLRAIAEVLNDRGVPTPRDDRSCAEYRSPSRRGKA